MILAVAFCAVTWFFNREQEKALPKPEACPVVSNVIDVIVSAFAPSSNDVRRLDVRKLKVADFAAAIAKLSPEAALWTPGEGDWLVVGAARGCSNTLERVMDAFAGADTVFSMPEVFANYVGTLSEIKPAFSVLNPADGVVPELFVAKEVPAFGWLTDGDLDADMAKRVRQEMRSMQVVRRVVLEGDMLSRAQKEDEAITKWSNAYRRAPNDTLLLERMHHLRKNAEVFYKVGKYGMASKCYETLIRIKPDDVVAAANLSECLKRLGKKELSEAVYKKAESMRK